MKKLLFIAGFSMAVLANFGLADEQKNTQQSKNTFKVNEEEAVNMSKQDWINLRNRMNENQESHFQAALQLDDAEERKLHREAAKNLDELKKKIDHRRWIEKEGGWGIAGSFDYMNLTQFSGDQSGILEIGIKLGVSKRQFHPNVELRAMAGIGWTNFGNSYYIPLNFEIAYAHDFRRNPSYYFGVEYDYSPLYNKTLLYVIAQPPFLDIIGIKLGYGLDSNLHINVLGKTIEADGGNFWTLGFVSSF